MSKKSFSWRSVLFVGIGMSSYNILWPIFNSLIPPLLANLGLSALLIGFIMTWDNIIMLFAEPWVGSRSDRVPGRFGHRKPWLMAGAPLAAFFFILVPFVRGYVVLIAIAILGTDIGMALFRAPTASYLGDLFPPRDRSTANGAVAMIYGVAAAIAVFGGGALFKIGVPLPFLLGAAAMLVMVAVALFGVREPRLPPLPAQEKSEGLILQLRRVTSQVGASGRLLLGAIIMGFCAVSVIEAFFTLYAINTLGIDVGTAAQMLTVLNATFVLFSLPSGLIGTRFGRKPTVFTGFAGGLVCMLAAFTLRSPAGLLVILGLLGIFWSLINNNALALVYDHGSQRDIGLLTGLYFFAMSVAEIAGPILAGGLIDWSGTNYASIWPLTALFAGAATLLLVQVHPHAAADVSAAEYQAPAPA